ncbi:MAG: hypothetical protein ABSF98_24890 [Bryobacteraceae bacterium]
MNLGLALRYSAAVCCTCFRSLGHARALGIRRQEYGRYFQKSIDLALCYAGFDAGGRVASAWRAGEAAFLCCAYDVVTDWRGFARDSRGAFEHILCLRTHDRRLRQLALGLYDQEKSNTLNDDGLERGAIALRLVLSIMKCNDTHSPLWTNVDAAGRLLQIVDDVLDYEGDLMRGEANCLISPRRCIYLRQLLGSLDQAQFREMLGRFDGVLLTVINRARLKAEMFLYRWSGSS